MTLPAWASRLRTGGRGPYVMQINESVIVSWNAGRGADTLLGVDGLKGLLTPEFDHYCQVGTPRPGTSRRSEARSPDVTRAQAMAAPPGWVGGFAESDHHFAYPEPDLAALPMLENMANIGMLERQQPVKWPEFSWETEPGNPESRCFQQFAPDISRIGYTDTGRVYSIICPQQGADSPAFGSMNVEVSVTGQRGWVDETTRTLAADMTVEGKIWFSPSAIDGPLVKLLWSLFRRSGFPFPADKSHAIRVSTYRPGDPTQPILAVRTGQTSRFQSPDFAQPLDQAWAVGNVEVEIGPILPTGDTVVDEFNQLVMDVFNLASGNLLKQGNVLTWNVWFTEPSVVDQQEWRDHAEKWRKSIDADHGSPDGPGTPARYFDGRPFKPAEAVIDEEIEKIIKFLFTHLTHLAAAPPG